MHRATEMRAGAALLDRVSADAQPQRFEQWLLVCACDYAAGAWRRGS
ncbi:MULTISPECIES: hypothetical protein [unclassified Burkholderia]|nr:MULTISPECIES: hypothetical protein [unclassified Burkholderia]